MKTLSFKTVLFTAAVIGPGLMLANPDRPVLAQEAGARQGPKKDEPKSKHADQANAFRVTTAPRNLTATAGRGEAVLFVVDERGNRILNAGRRSKTELKEATCPLRWAVVVGTIDFRTIREARFGKDRRDAEREQQLCNRIDLQRQTRNPDGTWTNWNDIDVEANYKVLDNITEVATERTRTDLLLEALVDPLPLLKSGEWRGVDVAAFLDPNAAKASTFNSIARRGDPLPLPADEVMVRCLDFTVQPEASYRYRTRVVLWDHKTQRGDMFGPWSGPTGAVTMPKE